MRLLKMALASALLLALVLPSEQQFFRRRFPGIGLAVGAGIALKSAAIGYYAGRRSRGRCCHGGGHRRWGGGYYGRRRRRELVTSDGNVWAPLTAEDRKLAALLEATELDAYFRLVTAQDRAGCGLKIVCELAAASTTGDDANQLDGDEKLILQLFGASVPRAAAGADSPKAAYDAAFAVGAAAAVVGGDGRRRCQQAFPSCAYDGRQVLRAARDAPAYP